MLEEISVQLARLEASEDDLELLKTSLTQLDEFFLLVVVGEFNAGKTAFLNALLSGKFLTEGVTPTTNEIHVIRYAETAAQDPGPKDYRILYMPVEWLCARWPGRYPRHQCHRPAPSGDHRTLCAAQRSWCSLSPVLTVPSAKANVAFSTAFASGAKKVVIIINKIVSTMMTDRQTVINFVRDNARQLLGAEPEVFPVSAKLAQQAKLAAKNNAAKNNGEAVVSGAQWDASNFGALERYVIDTLDIAQRTRLKLENPLGVASRLLDKYNGVIRNREELLRAIFRRWTPSSSTSQSTKATCAATSNSRAAG